MNNSFKIKQKNEDPHADRFTSDPLEFANDEKVCDVVGRMSAARTGMDGSHYMAVARTESARDNEWRDLLRPFLTFLEETKGVSRHNLGRIIPRENRRRAVLDILQQAETEGQLDQYSRKFLQRLFLSLPITLLFFWLQSIMGTPPVDAPIYIGLPWILLYAFVPLFSAFIPFIFGIVYCVNRYSAGRIRDLHKRLRQTDYFPHEVWESLTK